MTKRPLTAVFVERLKRLGIDVELSGNFPWIYLRSVNGVRVVERYAGNHGFTAFWYPTKLGDEEYRFSDRKKVFEKVRELVEGDEFIPELTEDDEYDRIGC